MDIWFLWLKHAVTAVFFCCCQLLVMRFSRGRLWIRTQTSSARNSFLWGLKFRRLVTSYSSYHIPKVFFVFLSLTCFAFFFTDCSLQTFMSVNFLTFFVGTCFPFMTQLSGSHVMKTNVFVLFTSSFSEHWVSGAHFLLQTWLKVLRSQPWLEKTLTCLSSLATSILWQFGNEILLLYWKIKTGKPGVSL